MTQFSIGCDPEIFLVDRDGKPVSAYGVVKGTKKEPYKVDKGAYQVDGMALEFNTDPVPAADAFDQFNTNITTVLKRLKEDVKANGYKTVKFNIAPVQDFGEEIMAEQPDEAKELGCDPDYCAYTKEPNPRPKGDVTFRTASGHIHVGWGADIPADHPDHIDICCSFVKMLDATIGLFMTLIDTDPRRRELYGKAGAFRPKPYGVEYRTPSNLWLTHVSRRRIVYRLVNIAINMASSGRGLDYYIAGRTWSRGFGINPNYIDKNTIKGDAANELVRKVINNGDRETALKLLNNVLDMSYYSGMSLKTMVNREYQRTINAAHGNAKEKKVA